MGLVRVPAAVGAEAGGGVEDGGFGEVGAEGVERPVPVGLGTVVGAFFAEGALVAGDEETVPCEEVSDPVDQGGLELVLAEEVFVAGGDAVVEDVTCESAGFGV